MTFFPRIESLTSRAGAPEEAEGASSLLVRGGLATLTASAAIPLRARFPSGAGVDVSLTALDGEAFLLEIGAGPWPLTDALPRPTPPEALRWRAEDARTFACGATRFRLGPDDVAPGRGGVPAQFSFLRALEALTHALDDTPLLASVGEDYNVGNVPMRFPLFRYRDAHVEGYGVSLGLSHGDVIYGAGEDFGSLAKNGRVFDFINADALGVNGETRYQSTPTFCSSRGWSITVLSREPCRVDVGRSRADIMTITSGGPRLRLLLQFLPGARERASQLRALLAGIAGVRGVPSWTLGLWLSRCFYKDQAEVDGVIAAAKEHDFPPGVVNLDARCWMRATTRTDFVWDTSRFEPFESYLPSLRDRGYEVCLWENPYVSCATETLHAEGVHEGFFAKTPEGETYALQWVPEGLPGFPKPPDAGLVDFTNPAAREWWKDKHRPFLRAGVKCFKTDFGEEIPFDAVFSDGSNGWELRNAYSDLYNDCVTEVLREEHGDDAIVWARSGWLHTFRYPVKWGGDSQTHFRALRGSLRAALSQAAGGAMFWSYDIGGFYGEHPDPRFFLRAFQMGMYFTHARTHGITEREPWRFGPEVERLCRTALRARLALLPYLEHVMRASAQRAESGVLPLWMTHPFDPTTAHIDDAFFLGDDLLVAPYLDAAATRSAYLPVGRWRDLRTGTLHEGGRWLALDANAQPHAPAFARVDSAFRECFDRASAILGGDNGIHLP
jgi:alpha-D-xyloside xylohydrolase